ncbi:hypothetical protein [Prosthecobacter fusiformis]|nr:hypothetical protein [Prosthecobacter fusiformis]
MKNFALLIIAIVCYLAASRAEAGQCRPYTPPVKRVVCQPVYSHTKVIACRTECRWALDHCGRRYSYEVKVVTYADVYTDGTLRTYTQEVQA